MYKYSDIIKLEVIDNANIVLIKLLIRLTLFELDNHDNVIDV